MDYDDNDFQKNLHLAGEGSTKFPPSLRSYALPKFDFDESLPANLRFDSLVETEVFLGIESNEDNHWIDAFSRGSSGIEFSSTAAGSCPISRDGNVWSEATSSESVEMLLKSVGQEDYIPKQTTIQESDACDELACLTKQMDSNPKLDDKNEFKDNVAVHPPAGTHGSFSALKENAEMEKLQDVMSQSQEGELSIVGSSGTLKLSNICSQTLYTDDKSDNTNRQEVEFVADGIHNGKTQDDSSAVRINTAESSMQNLSDEKQGRLETQTNNHNTGSSMMNKEAAVDQQTLDRQAVGGNAHYTDKPLCPTPSKETSEGRPVDEVHETGLSSIEDSLRMESAAVSDLQKTDKCSEDTSFIDLSRDSARVDVMLPKDVAMDDQSVPNASELPKISIKDDTFSGRQVVEVSNSTCEICPNLEQNMDVGANKTNGGSSVAKENELSNTDDHVDTQILSSKSEAFVFTLEENKVSTGSEVNRDNRIGGFSSSGVVGSSAKSSILGESTQICVINDSEKQNDSENFDRNVSVNDQESKKTPSDSSPMHCDVDQSHLVVDKGVISSSPSAGSTEIELETSTASLDVTPVNNLVSQVITGNTCLTSHEVIDIPHPSGKVISPDGVTGHNDIHGITPGGSSSVMKEETTIKIAEEASMSALVGSSDQESAPCPVMGADMHHSSDTSGQPVFEVAISDVHNVRTTSDTVRIDEPQGTTNDTVIVECARESGLSQVLCASPEKQSDAVTVSLIKKDKETVLEGPDKSSLIKLGDKLLGPQGSMSSASLPDSCGDLHETGSGSFPIKSTCSPSSTFGSPSETEKDKTQDKASDNKNPQASECINAGEKNKLSTAQDLKDNIAANDERRNSSPNATSTIDLSKKDAADVNTEDVSKAKSIPNIATIKASTAMEGSPSTSGLGVNIATVGISSQGNLQITDRKVASSASKTTPERKTRRPYKRSYDKAVGKESSKRGSRLKDTTPARQSDRGGKSAKVSLSPSPGFQLMKSNEVQQYGPNDSNSTKTFALVNTPTSSLPDLNTSASPPVFFHQPFTDLQQLQLRAQIIVYGALIQGTAPDDICMVQAFGGSDGGRSIWENAWRDCMERQHGKKSLPVNPETPVQSRSVARTSDSPLKQSTVQGKGISSPLGRASSKATSTVASPLISISSPLWSLPTLSSDSLQSSALARGSGVDYPQAINQLNPYQTPPGRNFLGHNTPWISQTSLRGQWITSSTPPDNSTRLSASPVLDTIKLGSAKGSSLPPSGLKNVTSSPPTSNTGLQGIFAGSSSPLDANNVVVSPVQHSSDPKPKKRKKVVVSEDLVQRSLPPLAPAVSSHMPTSIAIVTSVGNVPITTVEKSVVSVSPLADQSKNNQKVELRIMSDESLMKIKEARVHAEEASTHSAAAVNHSLELWNQLEKHKDSGLMSDIEAKLASAAVAVAAATAVAKAAAAAANVASNAALQAKLMADEALVSSGYDNSCQSNQISLSEATNTLGKATPASILKGANGTNCPGSIIVAAKEAVKRRVEAASAATKRAENMDAILKAAELAAEAISQAGKIVTMGDPLSLSDIVEAGPEGCLKATPESSWQVGLLKDFTRDTENVEYVRDIPETSHTHNRNISSGDISASVKINERNSRGSKGRKVSDLVKPAEVIPGSEPETQAPLFSDINGCGNFEENNIKEGSLVEVFKDEEGYKAGWFIANILSLKDDKAYVCYTSLVAVEGPLKEWVSLGCEGNRSPRIRIARPLTIQYEGTRKRRRAAMADHAWSVGDRVDAWIQESWKEGVITEKNRKDETTLTIHFPASGETSVVRAWHLRPSLVWKDGKWIESSIVGANDSSNHEGDTPHEKRPKLGIQAVEVKGKDKLSKGIDAGESANPDDMRLLNLTENERVFNIGKTSKNENKQDPHRMVRTGLQKEGSRVIFGIPKPGKKRKFMEVSKHYVERESSKVNDRNDSVKLSNFLMPHGSVSRGWKNSSKNDTREKLGADSKPRNFKSGKPQGVLGRVIPPKDISSSNALSLTHDQTSHAERIKGSSNHSYSATDGATEGPILFSSLATATDTHPTRRAPASRASKGKLAPASEKSGKGDAEKVLNDNPMKTASDIVEPRRSNRRIQPTSRLLEGLQSSLIISKIPSVSHNRNPSKGNN